MARVHRVAVLAVAVASVFALDACRKPPEVQPAPAPVPNQDSIDAANAARQAREDSIRMAQEAAARERARQDSIDRANAMAAAEQTALRNTMSQAIYFEYDRSDLSASATAALDAKVPIMMANSGMMIRISGHTDERGSSEYNIALGQRRAATAKRYLTDRGVDAGRVETVSFGEERPVCQMADESCYSQNRRDEFEITAGGTMIVKPNMP